MQPTTATTAFRHPRADKFTVIVKPTHACNLRCVYCYVPDSAEKGRMSIATLRNLMNQTVAVAAGKEITFIWHGGEPLLLGSKFFRQVAAISHDMREQGHRIKNAIQTNGTLITDELLDFIVKEDDFRIGLSLDGPAQINDAARPRANGSGSFAGIIRAITKIREREACGARIGGGAICVISRQNIHHLEEIYSFFKSQGLSIKLSPLFVSGRATSEHSVTPDEYAEAMCRLFDIWFHDDDPNVIRVDPFETLIESLVSGIPASCALSTTCTMSFVSVGPLGDIYPCGRFDGIKDFHLGNVNAPGGLRDALTSSIHVQLDSRPKKLDVECMECPFLSVCNGGCMHNAYLGGDVMGKDPFCKLYKRLFAHMLSRLHDVLAKAECLPSSTELPNE